MNLSILVGSCDEYSFLWNKFIYLFNKYWDHDLNLDKYILTQNLHVNSDQFKTIATGKIPWTQRLKLALDNIKSDYILWLQDDYFFIRKIPSSTIQDYLNFITQYNIDRFGIHENSNLYIFANTAHKYVKYSQLSLYTISLQASIWNKQFLLSCIDNDETPWQFEIDGSNRLNYRQHNIYLDVQNPPWYLEAMKQGKHTIDYYNICKQEGLDP